MSVRRTQYLLVAALLCIFAGSLVAGVDEVPMARLTVEVEINATPDQVWAHLTGGKSLVAWCPYWKNSSNREVNLSKIGDVLAFEDDWGNTGRSIVTFLDKQQEIRVAHEPEDGSYMCQAKFILEPSEKGTVVLYVEQYTDESDAESFDATAEQVEQQMRKALAALKKSVETKS